MQFKKMAVRYSRTVNLGNFESCKVEAEFEVELDEGEDPEVARKQLAEQVKGAVREQLQPLAKVRMDQIREVADGLPADLRKSFVASLNGGNGNEH